MSQGVSVEVFCLLTPSSDNTEQLLRESGVTVVIDDEPGRTIQEIDGHFWGNAHTYEYMSRLRNRLLDLVAQTEAPYFFSLDSDMVLPKGALVQLLDYAADHPGVVSPAANMTTGEVCWNTMSWVDPRHPGMANRPVKYPSGGKADVVMGAMLLDRTAMACQWESWPQGEDIGFCIRAEELAIDRWWVPEVKIRHLMRR